MDTTRATSTLTTYTMRSIRTRPEATSATAVTRAAVARATVKSGLLCHETASESTVARDPIVLEDGGFNPRQRTITTNSQRIINSRCKRQACIPPIHTTVMRVFGPPLYPPSRCNVVLVGTAKRLVDRQLNQAIHSELVLLQPRPLVRPLLLRVQDPRQQRRHRHQLWRLVPQLPRPHQ